MTGSLAEELASELGAIDPDITRAATDTLPELRERVDARARSAIELLDGHGVGEVLRVPKGRLADLQQCERLALARHDRPDVGPAGAAALRGVALDRFVLLEVAGAPIVDPVDELLSVLDVQGELDTCDQVVAAAAADPRFVDDLAAAAAVWRGLPSDWWPRLQSPATAQLAEGRAVCSGRLDVEVGGPLTGVPGVVLEVKSGAPRVAHVEEVALYALLVGWRDGVAPALVVRWYPNHPPACLPVDAGVLASAALRLGDALEQWAQLRAGRPAVESAGPWCRWCPDAPVCPSAAPLGAWVGAPAGSTVPAATGSDAAGTGTDGFSNDEVEWEPPDDEVDR